MQRRKFLKLSTLTGVGLSFPNAMLLSSCASMPSEHSHEFKQFVFELLKDWCDGMIAFQIIEPSDPSRHGMMLCLGDDVIHARSMDAVYPFFCMANITGDKKYLNAGIAALEWADNVTLDNGAWANGLEENAWTGTTVFGAIALAETLYYHSHLLSDERRAKWLERLRRAAEFVEQKITIDFSNINYPATAVYGFRLFSDVLNSEHYLKKSRQLAAEVMQFFTENNILIYGEGKPKTKKSGKGLRPIDLGYNVEESLNGLVMYALLEQDEAMLNKLTKSMTSHLAFMLPDGGWDNSWGTRQFKWTYWGSRTSDGCAPAFAMMADRNPAFATAVIKNTELLRACTAENGLLYGGLHYASHHLQPCIHHTFAHAKPLATLLDHWDKLPALNTKTPLPRAVAEGVTHFEDLDTTLFARGSWRGTVTAYDAIYQDGNVHHPTGGVLSLLYHLKVGLLCAGSMAIYWLKEANNQQPAPDEDIALTPRIEALIGDEWYSNLFDLNATIETLDNQQDIHIKANAQLKNKANQVVNNTASDFTTTYQCSNNGIKITAITEQAINHKTAFVLPIVSPSTEAVHQPDGHTIIVQKPEGLVTIKSNVKVMIKKVSKARTFNMVPGVEAIPIYAFFEKLPTSKVIIDIEVS